MRCGGTGNQSEDGPVNGIPAGVGKHVSGQLIGHSVEIKAALRQSRLEPLAVELTHLAGLVKLGHLPLDKAGEFTIILAEHDRQGLNRQTRTHNNKLLRRLRLEAVELNIVVNESIGRLALDGFDSLSRRFNDQQLERGHTKFARFSDLRPRRTFLHRQRLARQIVDPRDPRAFAHQQLGRSKINRQAERHLIATRLGIGHTRTHQIDFTFLNLRDPVGSSDLNIAHLKRLQLVLMLDCFNQPLTDLDAVAGRSRPIRMLIGKRQALLITDKNDTALPDTIKRRTKTAAQLTVQAV